MKPITKIICIDHTKIAETLYDFPLLIEWAINDAAEIESFAILASDQTTPLACEILSLNASLQIVSVIARVPELSHHEDTLLYLNLGCAKSPSPRGRAWGKNLFFAGTGTETPRVNAPLDVPNAITVEAWVCCEAPVLDAVQCIVSQWELRSGLLAFDAYDAGNTSGLDTAGYFGAVFDGRFVYFSPQHDTVGRHGKVLRYDTHGPFTNSASWEAYDAGNTGKLSTKGYYGSVFDGRYVIFVPRRDDSDFHSRFLRYDTRGAFTDPASWISHNAGVRNSYQSAAFDGRYIYCAPGQQSVPVSEADPNSEGHSVTGMTAGTVPRGSGLVMRVDSYGDFMSPSSYVSYNAERTNGFDTRDFDGAICAGHCVYFAPLSYGKALRYDMRGHFTDPTSWAAFDARPLGLVRSVGAIFDGRYVYYVPYGGTTSALRYDISRDFTDRSSWDAFNLLQLRPWEKPGYIGAVFDGRFVYYIPFLSDGVYHGDMLRYDTLGAFADPGSWQMTNAGLTSGLRTVGFNGAAFDGRYIYCAPWSDGIDLPRLRGHGRVLRYDTAGPRSTFSLRYSDCGHNGGLGAAMPGPRFIVATNEGVVSISANRPLSPGRHHLAGTYDGSKIKLFVDGQLANQQDAHGTIQFEGAEFLLGSLAGGAAAFTGTIGLYQVSNVARSAGWLATEYANQYSPREFALIGT